MTFPARARGAVIGPKKAGKRELDDLLAPDSSSLSTLGEPAVLEFSTTYLKAEIAVQMVSKAIRRVVEEDPIVALEEVKVDPDKLADDQVPSYMRKFQALRLKRGEAMLEKGKKDSDLMKKAQSLNEVLGSGTKQPVCSNAVCYPYCTQNCQIDPTQGYEPPTEITSNKAKLKARQTRRIISLIRHLRKHNQTASSLAFQHQQRQQLQHEWNVIRRAQGYGRAWDAWVLSFECIHFVPDNIPSLEWLVEAYQLTKFDADAYARQEAQLRRHHRRHSLVLAKSHNNNANAYRFIKGKEQRFLNDFPYEITTQATLCRAFRNQPKIRLSEHVDIPQGACIEFGNCTATVHQVADKTLTLADVVGCLPGAGLVRYKSHAYTMPTMSREFQAFWSQFWMRDSYESQHSDAEWQSFIDDLEETIPPQPMLTVAFDNPKFHDD